MILDDETFGELVGHLGRVSEAILKTARHVAALSNDASSEEDWAGTFDKLMAVVLEMIVIDRIVGALLAANCEETTSRQAPAEKKPALLSS